MAPPIPTPDSSIALAASYTSPSDVKSFSYSLTTRALLDTTAENKPAQFSKAKTAYLSELRSSVKQMQGDINLFLTVKMEQDKQSMATNGQKGKDEVEEEKYGEEDVDEDG